MNTTTVKLNKYFKFTYKCFAKAEKKLPEKLQRKLNYINSKSNNFKNVFVELIDKNTLTDNNNSNNIERIKLNYKNFLNINNINTISTFNDTEIFKSLNEYFIRPTWSMLDRGGKKWRVLLAYLIGEMLGENYKISHTNIINLLFVGEIIHNATLITDDLADKSEKRRGKPCVHLLYGEDSALMTGLGLLFMPFRYFMNNLLEKDELLINKESNYYNQVYNDIMSVYLDELTTVNLGQVLDTEMKYTRIPQTDTCLDVFAAKTCVLPRMLCKWVINLIDKDKLKANTSIDDLRKDILIGVDNISLAMQINDDLLNIKNSAVSENKGIVGEDIFEGKQSIMVLHSLNKGLIKDNTLRNIKEENNYDLNNINNINTNTNPNLNLLKGKSKRLYEIILLKTKDQSYINEAINIMHELGSIEYAELKKEELYFKGVKQFENIKHKVNNNEIVKDIEDLFYYLIKDRI